MTNLLAYHGDPKIKRKYMARLAKHRKLDHLTQGVGWESNGVTRGCAVGCTLEGYSHARYPIELGIPIEIAQLEDGIFEGLPRKQALKFPTAFLRAIEPGADLSIVWPRFTFWMLSDTTSPMYKPAQHEDVRRAVSGVADLYESWIASGIKPSDSQWAAARDAASAAAMDAARAAARDAASAAASAAARDAARTAARDAARAAARDAARAAARDAARVAAWDAAMDAAWKTMRDKLIELLKNAPVVKIRAIVERKE